MLSKFSVKKPYTVLVGVLLALVLGFVSFTKMQADLLPNINFPYVVVMTTYIGASPESVETVVTAPVESAMATISNIESITSMSSENYSVVILQFAQTANMDSVSLEIRESLDQLESYWDDSVGHPIIMKINPNMLPTMILAVGADGMDDTEIASFASDKVIPAIESIEGVASVNATGLIEKQVNVIIRGDKIDAINEQIYKLIDEKFEEAYDEIQTAKEELSKNETELKKGQNKLNSAAGTIDQNKAELTNKKDSTIKELSQAKLQTLTAKADLEAAKTQINSNVQMSNALFNAINQLEEAIPGLKQAQGSLSTVDYQTSSVISTYQSAVLGHTNGYVTDEQFSLAQTNMNAYKQSLIGGGQTDIGIIFAAQPAVRGRIAQIDFGTSDAYTNFKTILDEYSTYLASTITSSEAQLASTKLQLTEMCGGTTAQHVQAYCATQQMGLPQINEAIGKLDENIKTLYENESEALIQFSNGMASLDLAKSQLESSKTEITSGKAKLDDAKNQLEDAEEKIEDQKAEAKEKADMAGILTEDLITKLLSAQNFEMPAGYVMGGDEKYLVRVGDKPETVEDLMALPLIKFPMEEDKVITLGDVAEIFESDNSGEVYANVNGKPGIILSIQKQTGYSTGTVAKLINKKIADLKDTYSELSLVPLMDQGIYIDLVTSSIFENVLLGAALAVLVLILFLRDIRPTIVIALSIPISIIVAIVCMYFSGVTLNIISLSGLALGVGMLVDNSIVVIENIYRMRNDGMEIKEAAIEGAREVAGAIFASTLTTVSVFLPIVFTEGITRQLFVDMGLTIAYSLLASLVVALTVVPALSTGLLRNINTKAKEKRTKNNNGYKKFLEVCLKLKPLVLLLAVGLLVGSAFLAARKGIAYFPEMESTQISVDVSLAEESPLTDVVSETDEIIARIMEIPDVVDAGAMASSSSLSMLGGMRTNSSETTATSIYVLTKEKREHTGAELAKIIQEKTADIEGITVSVNTSTMDMSALGGSGISVEIKGRDLDVLYEKASEVADILAKTEGVAKVTDISRSADPEYRITVNKEKAAQYSLTVAQVFQEISTRLQDAKVATKLSTATEDISVYVTDEKDEALQLDDIKNIEFKYTDEDGEAQTVKLSEIASFKKGYGMSTIRRSGQSRIVTVSASLAEGYNIGLVTADAKDNMKELSVPKGYSVEFAGENEQIVDALEQLVLMLILAVVFIYLIMVAQFQSLLSPFIIMFTIPLAFTGGFAALFLTNNELSIIAMIGFVMLSGIIVNNGIVLVDYINQRRLAGMSKHEAILDAGATRLRPVLMTALTTILALLTMAFSNKMGADMAKPLAIVVIGGMIYGTLMTLVVVPCIYDIFMKEKKLPKPPRHKKPELIISEEDYDDKKSADPIIRESADMIAPQPIMPSDPPKAAVRELKLREKKAAPANPYMVGWKV